MRRIRSGCCACAASGRTAEQRDELAAQGRKLSLAK